MERFVFSYSELDTVINKTVDVVTEDPPSAAVLIERFFSFLEAAGVDADTIEDATAEVMMDRLYANVADPISVDEEPFELEIEEYNPGFGIGV